jgi:hypothetical protein
MYGKKCHAFIMLDLDKAIEDESKAVLECADTDPAEPGRNRIFLDKKNKAGKLILLASKDYKLDEIMPLYEARHAIKQFFDITKTNASMPPLKGRSDETIRGAILLSFVATAVRSFKSLGLHGSKISADLALDEIGYLSVHFFESGNAVEELTPLQKRIFAHLNINCPISLESINPFQTDPSLPDPERRMGGRPKGNATSNGTISRKDGQNPKPDGKSKRGRP